MCVPGGSPQRLKEAVYPLELGLQTFVSYRVGAFHWDHHVNPS